MLLCVIPSFYTHTRFYLIYGCFYTSVGTAWHDDCIDIQEGSDVVKIEFDISQGNFDSMRKAFHVFMPNKDCALTATDWLRASILFYQGMDRWLGPRYHS